MSRIRKWFESHADVLVVVAVHTVAWLLYFSFFFLSAIPQSPRPVYRVWLLVGIAIMDIPIFYYFYNRAVPRLLAGKKGWLFTGILLLLLGLYPFVRYSMDLFILYIYPDYRAPLTNILSKQFWPVYLIRALSCLFVVVMASVGKFTFDWFKNARIRRELETQNLSSELAFLKSQINPHFLFNTLNNIHTLAYKKSDEAPEAIMKLSDLMRYMLYESDAEQVPLDTEMAHLKSFIGLQALRFKSPDIVDLEITGDTSTKTIAPLILLPFIENAFKHGYQLNRAGAISIQLHVGDDIQFSVQNDKPPAGRQVQKDEAGGIGLENISRRLELIYKTAYTLRVDETSSQFKVSLCLKQDG